MPNHYIIIAGTTKAGTTSLYNYLGSHPEVDKCIYKESRYFLDTSYPLPNKINYRKKTYFDLFTDNKKTIKLEATPDYLYSQGTPNRIKEYLSGHDISILISLRNPIDRIISWFNYSKQIGFISQKMTFDEFIDISMKGDNKNLPFIALEQGNYSRYLENYRKVFNKCIVIIFEELIKKKEQIIEELYRNLNLEAANFDPQKFIKYNESKSATFSFFQRWYAKIFRYSKDIAVNYGFQNNFILKKVNAVAKNVLSNSKTHDREIFRKNNMTLEQKTRLVDFYKSDVINLGLNDNYLDYWHDFK